MRKFTFYIISFCFSTGLFSVAAGQEKPDYELDEIVITATRIPAINLDSPRSITIIDSRDIQELPVHSVQGLLEYALGVDIRQRAPLGVQADVSICGGSIEQSLVLINGIQVNDAQTGHHNLNLPISLNDIDRIEVVRGAGSTLYGANAVGGVINIITKSSFVKQGNVKGSFGDYGFGEGEFSISYPIVDLSQQFSFSKRKSDGYIENTDSDITSLSYNAALPIASRQIKLSSGYLDKKFGANKFYSDAFPDQWERTKTAFVGASGEIQLNKFRIIPKFYFRRNVDDFVLKRYDPEWYHNHHETDNFDLEIQSSFHTQLGTTILGGEIGTKDIQSSNLGNHQRYRGGLFCEQHFKLGKRIDIFPGAYTYYYTDWGWKILPGINISSKLSDFVQLYTSINKAYRVPTYTELYYLAPNNIGNPELRPEEAWTYEVGLKMRKNAVEGSFAFFRRNGFNLIDWIRYNPNDAWQALNISRIQTNGIEMNAWFYPMKYLPSCPITRVNLSYSYLQSNKKADDFESKYILDYLRHQLIFTVDTALFLHIHQNWRIRYKERVNFADVILIDTKLFTNYNGIEFFIEASNLLDRRFEDVQSIPMPGRWIRLGFAVKQNL